MNKIEKLIQQLCPQGVEFKELGKIALSLKKGTLKQGQLQLSGKYPVINSGREWYGYYGFYNNEENAIAIASRGEYAGFLTYVNQKFWAGGLCYPYRSKDETVIITKFIYFYLKMAEPKIMDVLVARGSIPALNKGDIDKFQIPIPPLPIQQEIVAILDKFTQLEAELEAELEARKTQYEYYRNELLNFEGKEVEWKTLGEVCHIQSGGTPSKNKTEYWNGGTIKWLGSTVCKNKKRVDEITNFITELGFKNSSAKLFKKETTLIALVGATIGKTAFLPYEATTNQNVAGLYPKDTNKLNTSYLFFSCKALYEIFTNLSQDKLKMANLTFVRGLKIPIPHLAEQERIVGILDKFDALVNGGDSGSEAGMTGSEAGMTRSEAGMTGSLPAEIKARHQQYEFYRGKLLDFKPLITV